MVLKWFDTAAVDAFADTMVNMFVSRFPATEFSVGGKKQEARFRKVQATLAQELTGFRRKHPLNIYKKARLANRFKWALKEAGYPDSFIDELAYELATLSAIPD
ncbi:MAG: hypothetical protein V4669_06090 [Pseudomonadota bacterium]